MKKAKILVDNSYDNEWLSGTVEESRSLETLNEELVGVLQMKSLIPDFLITQENFLRCNGCSFNTKFS